MITDEEIEEYAWIKYPFGDDEYSGDWKADAFNKGAIWARDQHKAEIEELKTQNDKLTAIITSLIIEKK